VNGKLRGTIEIPNEKADNEIEVVKLAKASLNVQKYFENVEIVKVVYVEGRMINFVVK
jgi:leucyl-tRNA synthetase